MAQLEGAATGMAYLHGLNPHIVHGDFHPVSLHYEVS